MAVPDQPRLSGYTYLTLGEGMSRTLRAPEDQAFFLLIHGEADATRRRALRTLRDDCKLDTDTIFRRVPRYETNATPTEYVRRARQLVYEDKSVQGEFDFSAEEHSMDATDDGNPASMADEASPSADREAVQG